MDADGYFSFVSEKAYPCGHWNDPKQLREDVPALLKDENFLTEDTVVCSDGGYGRAWAQGHDIDIVTPHRKKQNRELSERKLAENDVIGSFRGDIERRFGTTSKTFEWWSNHGRGYQGCDEFLASDIKSCTFPFYCRIGFVLPQGTRQLANGEAPRPS